MLPDVIIIGAPKSGTTSLHHWLADHPQVVGPSVKETEYFVDKSSHAYHPEANYHHQGVPGYEKFFSGVDAGKAKVVFESAPDYMYQDTALEHLPSLVRQATFVFVLREPASQIYSLFHYLRNNWQYLPDSMTFTEFVGLARENAPELGHHELLQHAIDNGRYLRHIEKWISRCGEERIRVYLFDDMLADNRRFMCGFANDLGVDPQFYDDYAFGRENETYRVRSHRLQRVNLALRERLPTGRVYRWLRGIYRRLNTASGSLGKSDEERATLLTLRRELAVDNQALADRFDLDLSGWLPEEGGASRRRPGAA